MTKNKKALIFAGVVAAVGIGYILYTKFMKKPDELHNDLTEPQIPGWDFIDNHWGADATHKLGFIGATNPPFVTGDKITIKQKAGATHPEYSGATTVSNVKKVGNKWVVSIPKMYRGSTPVNGGSMKLI